MRRNRFAVVAGALIAATLAGGLALEYWLGAFARTPRVSQVVQLTQTGRVAIGNGVATDGSRIYFTERTGGQWSLAQVSVKGGTPAPVPVTPPISSQTSWISRPDRSSLLVSGEPRRWRRPASLDHSRGGRSCPPDWRCAGLRAGAWSRDGRRIVFARGSALFRVNIDGTDCRKLVDARNGGVDAIRWAPAPGPDVLRLCIHDHDTGAHCGRWPRTAPACIPCCENRSGADSDYGGSWIPSGKYYLFLRSAAGTASLWAIRENRAWLPVFGRRPVQIYSTPLAFPSLAPSPDGKRVFFASGQERRELVRYDAGAASS
jgi:hypothetical protein